MSTGERSISIIKGLPINEPRLLLTKHLAEDPPTHQMILGKGVLRLGQSQSPSKIHTDGAPSWIPEGSSASGAIVLNEKSLKKFKRKQKLVFMLTFLGWMFAHGSRKTVENTKQQFQDEWGWSTMFLGALDAGFLFSFAAGLLLLGPYSDIHDPVMVVGLALIFAGLLTINFAIAYDVLDVHTDLYFFFIFCLLGLVHSFTFPSSVKIIGNWFDHNSSGWVFGLWSASTPLGNIFGALMVVCSKDLNLDIEWNVLNCAFLLIIVGSVMLPSIHAGPWKVRLPHPEAVSAYENYMAQMVGKSLEKKAHEETDARETLDGNDVDLATSVRSAPNYVSGEDGTLEYSKIGYLSRAEIVPGQRSSSEVADAGDLAHSAVFSDEAKSSLKARNGLSDGRTSDAKQSQSLQDVVEGNEADVSTSQSDGGHGELVRTLTAKLLKRHDTQQRVSVSENKPVVEERSQPKSKDTSEDMEYPSTRTSRRDTTSVEVIDFDNLGLFRKLKHGIQIEGVLVWSISFALVKAVNYTIFSWLPYYIEYLGHTDTNSNWISMLYDLGFVIGGIGAGRWSDVMGGKRAIPTYAFLVTAVIPIAVLGNGYNDTTFLCFTCLICGIFVGGPTSLISTAVAHDLTQQKRLRGNNKAVATVIGIVDGVGTVGAAITQLIVASIASADNWRDVFYMLAIYLMISMMLLYRIFINEYDEWLAEEEMNLVAKRPSEEGRQLIRRLRNESFNSRLHSLALSLDV